MTRRGPKNGLQILIVPPLFEELNFCRALLADIQRSLAAMGFGSALIDLPGCGESEHALESVGLPDWQQAIEDSAAVLGDTVAIAGIRGGGLIDRIAADTPRWRLSPVDGPALLRGLDRATALSNDRVVRGGYALSDRMLGDLGQARIAASPRTRTVRLRDDPRPADRHVDAAPLWRRAEPARDPAAAALFAADMIAWFTSCGN